MNIAILGSNSFLASYLVKTLNQHSCFLFARSGPIVWETSKNEFPDLSNMDVVIFCAAAGVQSNKKESVEDIWQTNLHYPSALLQHLKQTGFTGTWISFGSYFEIGLNNEEQYFNEEAFLSRKALYPNDYCHSKAVFTRLIASLSERSALNFKHLHLIIPGLYGPGENQIRLFPYILQSIKNNENMKFSSGLQKRQFLHVQDLALLVEKCLNIDFESGIYNLTETFSITVREAIEEAIRIFAPNGYEKVEIGAIETRDEKMAFLGIDDSKAREKLQWNPSINLTEGLKSYL